jgi:hypothetical protein
MSAKVTFILVTFVLLTLVGCTGQSKQETNTTKPVAEVTSQPVINTTNQPAVTATAQPAANERGTTVIEDETGRQWPVHDTSRPAPPIITPGNESTQEQAGTAPSDAIVLFDGNDLSGWTSERGSQPGWIVRDGYTECVRGSGPIQTKQSFGSCQLHVEFATPSRVTGTSQGRGNSGVFIMSTYEVQVLDSYDNPTYPDGQCGSLYGRNVPLVNASRKPGQWQSFDIIYHRPLFEDGKVIRKATFTIFHNGVLIQDHIVLQGGTDWLGANMVSNYYPIADKLPLKLQDHSNPVRYRNIWIRELKD